MKHTLSVLVEDESVLSAGSRACSPDVASTSTAWPSAPPKAVEQSRITMVVEGDEQTLEQMTKQLDKLVNVLQVLDLTQRPAVERELMLLRCGRSSGDAQRRLRTGSSVPRQGR